MDFQTRRHSAVATTTAKMRKILITLGILVAFTISILATWIFGGRQLSLFLDRFWTIETASSRINSVVYEGSGTGGILHINDLALSLNDRDGPTPNVGTAKDGQLALADSGKVFAFGPPRSEAENLAAVPPQGDDARQYGPFKNGKSAYFISVNRGKESMAFGTEPTASRMVIRRCTGRPMAISIAGSNCTFPNPQKRQPLRG